MAGNEWRAVGHLVSSLVSPCLEMVQGHDLGQQNAEGPPCGILRLDMDPKVEQTSTAIN